MTGKEIKAIRVKLGLTQEEFALKLGVCTTTIQNWEAGKNSPSRLAQKELESLIK